jgi:MbtH protein
LFFHRRPVRVSQEKWIRSNHIGQGLSERGPLVAVSRNQTGSDEVGNRAINRLGSDQFSAMIPTMNDSEEDQIIYKVVVNHEEQYSIWPADRENPLGWRDVDKQGPKQECLEYIREVWTDMRPLSVRKQMDASQNT